VGAAVQDKNWKTADWTVENRWWSYPARDKDNGGWQSEPQVNEIEHGLAFNPEIWRIILVGSYKEDERWRERITTINNIYTKRIYIWLK
jgi:hypothetical protein